MAWFIEIRISIACAEENSSSGDYFEKEQKLDAMIA